MKSRNITKLEWVTFMVLLAAVTYLAAFGINHADESLIIAIISPVILALSIILNVALFFGKVLVKCV